jgi:hypothetical protein
MSAASNSFAAFSSTCSSTIGGESHENFVTFEGKGKVGITKTRNLSSHFEEKIKSGGPYSFITSKREGNLISMINMEIFNENF